VRGLDEITGRINVKQAHAFALDLAAEDELGVEVDAEFV
jgi:hypothetical protein